MRSRTTPLIVLAILGGAVITMACGASKAASSPATPPDNAAASAPQSQATTQAVATPTNPAPAPTSTPVAAATPTAAPAVAPSAPPPPPPAPTAPPPAAAPQTVTLTLGDNFFGTKEITLPAGVPITVTINNQGLALHNWDVAGVVKSNFIQHGQSQTVTFTAAPGTYTFQCDVHPKEMTGTLIVQ